MACSPRRTMSGSSGRGHRDVGHGADGVDGGGDLGVGRRHDLRALTQVHLVPVVLRRVVAGRDHHPGGTAEIGDRDGEHRRGQRPRHEVGLDAGAGHDRRGVLGEHVALAAGVEADHHTARRQRLPRRRAGSGPDRPRRAARSRGSCGAVRHPARRAGPRSRTGAGPRTAAASSSGLPAEQPLQLRSACRGRGRRPATPRRRPARRSSPVHPAPSPPRQRPDRRALRRRPAPPAAAATSTVEHPRGRSPRRRRATRAGRSRPAPAGG